MKNHTRGELCVGNEAAGTGGGLKVEVEAEVEVLGSAILTDDQTAKLCDDIISVPAIVEGRDRGFGVDVCRKSRGCGGYVTYTRLLFLPGPLHHPRRSLVDTPYLSPD